MQPNCVGSEVHFGLFFYQEQLEKIARKIFRNRLSTERYFLSTHCWQCANQVSDNAHFLVVVS